MRATTTSLTRSPVAPGVGLVPGTLADVTTAARLLQPLAPAGTSAREREALLRLALAHAALSSGALWLLLDPSTQEAASAVALLPPRTHPDVAATVWMAHLQLELAPPPGGDAPEAHLLLPPRRATAARELVHAALAGADGLEVVAPVPSHPVVAAVLRARGFRSDRPQGLLRRAG